VQVAACVKWVDLRPEVDRVHGTVRSVGGPGGAGWGISEADRAAVEVALQLGAVWSAPVAVVCAGPVGAEPVLRELLATFGVSPGDEAFARWMDAIVEEASKIGALELLEVEPGQARHGRGLFADPTRKLVRWVVHDEFNAVFENAWPALETRRELTR